MMASRMLVALTAIALAGPAAATVKAGVEKWQAGDHKGAVTEWLPFAARGDADALFNLGQAYKLGRGVDKDERIAQDYFRKSAAKNHPPAQERLGITLYADAATRQEAIRWLDQAARSDQPRAQYVLGVAYFNGDGVPRNWPLAYAYMLRANAKGIPQAANALTTMNANIEITDRQRGDAIAASLAAGSGLPAGTVDGIEPVRASVTKPQQTASAAPSPVSRPAAPRPPAPNYAPSKGGKWRVQLGAFSQQTAAAQAWSAAKSAQPAVLSAFEPVYAESAGVIRLQFGPFATRPAASAACAALTAAGRACFVVGF